MLRNGKDSSAEYPGKRQNTKSRRARFRPKFPWEPFDARGRTFTHHANRKHTLESSGAVDSGGRGLFHSCVGHLGVVGAGYSLAAFFSGMDLRCCHRFEPSWEPLGTLHWPPPPPAYGTTRTFLPRPFFNGVGQLLQWVHTGRLARPDLLLAVPACFEAGCGALGCLWAYSGRCQENPWAMGLFLRLSSRRGFSLWTWPYSRRAIPGCFDQCSSHTGPEAHIPRRACVAGCRP